MNEFGVPKQEVTIEVTLPTGEQQMVQVFINEFTSAHAGRERVSDLLASGQFLPAKDPVRGRFVLLNSAAFMVVRVARELELPTDAAVPGAATEHEVAVSLSNGRTLLGTVSYLMPPARNRLMDFINACPQFIRLMERDHVALVNRAFVAQIEPVAQ